MIGMRTRKPPVLAPPTPSSHDVDALEQEVAGWRQELSEIGQERAELQKRAAASGEKSLTESLAP